MRTALLVISGMAAAVFAVAFGATFFAHDHIVRLAEDSVIDRIRPSADQAVDAADRAARLRGVRLVLDAEQVQAARQEVAEYRADPRAYIARLVRAGGAPAAADPGKDAPPKDRVLFWKGQIRGHFDRTLNHLLFDLRVFFGSNFAVALLTAACAYWARGRLVLWLLPVAILLLGSLGFGTYLYVDNLSFFHILTDTYIGWGYPKFLAAVFLVLLARVGRLAFGLTAVAHRAAAPR